MPKPIELLAITLCLTAKLYTWLTRKNFVQSAAKPTFSWMLSTFQSSLGIQEIFAEQSVVWPALWTRVSTGGAELQKTVVTDVVPKLSRSIISSWADYTTIHGLGGFSQSASRIAISRSFNRNNMKPPMLTHFSRIIKLPLKGQPHICWLGQNGRL